MFNIGLNTHDSIFTHQAQTDHAFPVALHQILAMQESRGKESKDLCHNAAELILIFTSMEFIFKLRDDDINNSKIKKLYNNWTFPYNVVKK